MVFVSRVASVVLLLALGLLPACGPAATQPSGTIRLYTSVTQDTVDAVLAAFADAHPEIAVELFRAPTGEVDARIAAERREGGIKADVLWATDPLSTRQYDSEGLLLRFDPANAPGVPEAYREATYWGTRLLNVVMVANLDTSPMPSDWSDLADVDFADGVAIADPSFAGSALGTMAYFALDDAYGLDYLRGLAANGATQVQSVGDVITGVAEGQFSAGISLDKSIRDAVDAGSPVRLIWPSSGAIAIYSPIAVFESSANRTAAETFADFVLGERAQAAIASTGWQPIRTDVDWTVERGAQVAPDWDAAFTRRDELLADYRSIFGG